MLFGLFLASYIARCTYGACSNTLANPPSVMHGAGDGDTEWEAVPGSPNTWKAELHFDVSVQEWEAINTRIKSRLFNDSFPSQTMRMRRGNQYQVTVWNKLGPESDDNPTEMNVVKDCNTTNIHTHGVHISGTAPSDSVFTEVKPGESHTYVYNIPCDHAGGTFWWHPHHHGSTDVQVGAGAAGFLIIEDDAEAEGLPSWYTDMREQLFFLTHMDPDMYTNYNSDVDDDVWMVESLNGKESNHGDTWWVNGQIQPTICQDAGEWIKFRF